MLEAGASPPSSLKNSCAPWSVRGQRAAATSLTAYPPKWDASNNTAPPPSPPAGSTVQLASQRSLARGLVHRSPSEQATRHPAGELLATHALGLTGTAGSAQGRYELTSMEFV